MCSMKELKSSIKEQVGWEKEEKELGLCLSPCASLLAPLSQAKSCSLALLCQGN